VSSEHFLSLLKPTSLNREDSVRHHIAGGFAVRAHKAWRAFGSHELFIGRQARKIRENR
jgi:hypothetical protein